MDDPLFLRNEKDRKILSNSLNLDWYSDENLSFTVKNNFFAFIKKEKKIDESCFNFFFIKH